MITLRRQYEPEQGAIVYRIDSVVQIPDNWGLIVGDAAHNLRSALDHLAWQLAIRYFNGVPPTERKIIKKIQFPVVSDKNNWPRHPNREFMKPADASKLEQFQPFNLGPISRAKGVLHPLEELAGFHGLDNIDKHRTIHLTYVVAHQGFFTVPERSAFRDCEPITTDGNVHLTSLPPSQPPNPGEPILRIPIRVTGPNPDVDFKTRLTGYVAVREQWNVIEALDTFTEGVSNIIETFEPGARLTVKR